MDYNTDFEMDFEDRIMDTSDIPKHVKLEKDLIPLPDSIKNKINRFVHGVRLYDENHKGIITDDSPSFNCIVTGCSKALAEDCVKHIAKELDAGFRFIPYKASEGEMAALLTNMNNGEIGYIPDYERMSSQLKAFVSDAIRTNAVDIVTGKGHMATSYHLSLARATYILYACDINELSKEILEGFSVILNFAENLFDLRKYSIKRALKQDGFSADESVINLLAKNYYSEHSLQIKLLKIKSQALANGVNHISEQIIVGAGPEGISISSIDEMQAKEFELFIGNLLFLMGFENINVSNEIDSSDSVILADREKVRYCIRCQLSKKPIGIGTIKDAIVFREIHNCHVMCVITNNKYELAAKNLADVSNIVLWDRNDLEEFIENANLTRE